MARPAATQHIVSTPHTPRFHSAVTRYRTAVFTPSRGLQGVLLTLCCVAAGFMVVPGTLRNLAWVVGAVVFLWHVTEAPRSRLLAARSDPFRQTGEPETLQLMHDGIKQDLPDVGPRFHPWKNVVDGHFDDDYLYLALCGGEILGISLDANDQVAGSESSVVPYVRKATGKQVSRLDPSLRSRLHDTQLRRANYVDERPGLTERITGFSRSNKRRSGD